MIKRPFFKILIFYSLFISPAFIWSYSFQIDSLSNTTNTSSDSIRNNVLGYSLYSDLEMSRLFFYEFHDSLIIQLHKNLLSEQPDQNFLFQSSMSEQWRINEHLTNYIKLKKDLALSTDLGVFSKVLGNARTITAIILAILHVIKYKKGLY